MDYKVLYRKYRPVNFSELVGQETIKEILINSIKTNRIAHAYIFSGPRGTGKTSTAKIFAKTLNCLNNQNGISCENCEACVNFKESPDIIEIDAASNNGVEEIRMLRDNVKVLPYSSKYKVYIIDEVHMLSNSAWNAFLKTLEEPPSHVVFILATTEINKVPQTVLSRCQRFDFSKISYDNMYKKLNYIIQNEKIDITEDSINEIIKISNGCLRDALSNLDQISKLNTKITIEVVENIFGLISNKKLESLLEYLIHNQKQEIASTINSIEESGISPIEFLNEFIDFLINKNLNNEIDNQNMTGIKKIVEKLYSLLEYFNLIINPFSLIILELTTQNYFPGNNSEKENIVKSKSNKEKTEPQEKNIILTNVKTDNLENNKKSKLNETNEETKDANKNKKIRINNSFFNASKEYKKEFIDNWKKFVKKLEIDNNFNILGYINNYSVEVVSDKNVIFSFISSNDALIFNKNIFIIEDEYNKFTNQNYKFIGLSNEEWIREKKEYILNKDKYTNYIEENDSQNAKSKNLAIELFGNDIIEIR